MPHIGLPQVSIAVLTKEELLALLRDAAEQGARRALALAAPAALTTAQAAAVAGVKQKTVQEWIASGRLTAGKRGRLLTVMREDLERFLAGDRREKGRSVEDLLASLRVGPEKRNPR